MIYKTLARYSTLCCGLPTLSHKSAQMIAGYATMIDTAKVPNREYVTMIDTAKVPKQRIRHYDRYSKSSKTKNTPL